MSQRLCIAIDCDDVLIETTEFLVNSYNRKYNAQVTLQNAHTSGNPEWQLHDRAEVFRRLFDLQQSPGFAELAPLPSAVEFVHKFARKHDLHLVTARSTEVSSATQYMVDRYFPGCFVSIEHVGPDRPKGEVCAELHVDVMIDDNIGNLQTVLDHGIEHAVWFGDYLWQVEIEELMHNVVRCKDWKEVEGVILQYAT